MKLGRLTCTAVLTCLAGLASLTARAETVIFLEDFESYTDSAGIQAAWGLFTQNPHYTLDTVEGNPGKSLRMDSPAANNLGRFIRNLPSIAEATASKNVVFSVDMLLDPVTGPPPNFWNNARQFVEIRGYSGGSYNSGSLTQLLALGVFNSTINPTSNLYYQGRVTIPGTIGWQTLNSEGVNTVYQRATGWRNLKAVISLTDVKFYVNDTLCHVTGAPGSTKFDSAALGSGITSAGISAWVDNFKVSEVPIGGGATILDRKVVHGGWAGAGSAVDSVKVIHKEDTTPTQLTIDNLINTTRGINGIQFKIQDLGNSGALSVSDFDVQVSPLGGFDPGLNPPSGWGAGPAPSAVTVTGTNPYTVLVEWPDNSIKNQWLRLSVKANANTGLVDPEVYYLGHLQGEVTGASGDLFTILVGDILAIRGQLTNVVTSESIHDLDKTGVVLVSDILGCRSNLTGSLRQITVP
jgi:hypothetical protein